MSRKLVTFPLTNVTPKNVGIWTKEKQEELDRKLLHKCIKCGTPLPENNPDEYCAFGCRGYALVFSGGIYWRKCVTKNCVVLMDIHSKNTVCGVCENINKQIQADKNWKLGKEISLKSNTQWPEDGETWKI